MARLIHLLKLLLVFSLVAPFWTQTGNGDRKLVLLETPEVHGSPGDTVKLPCVLQSLESEIPLVKQITWERLEPWGNSSTVAEYDWARGPRILELGVHFVVAWKGQVFLDASLTLTELQPDDDANYTCEVTTFQHGSGRASTWLRVFYVPQVSISLYEDTRQQGHKETSLSCDARGNPEPRSYEWSTTAGPLPPYAELRGAQLLLLFQPSEESINTTFICCVSNALGTTQATKSVLLPGPSKEQQSWSPLVLIICLIVAVVIMVLGTLMYFCHFRKSRCDPQKTLENDVSTLCLQVKTISESCRNERETETRTVIGTVMGTEEGTEAVTKVEIEPEDEVQNKVEKIMKEWQKQHMLFSRIEKVTKWGTKEKAEADIDSGIDEQQSWVDDDWDSEPPSDDSDELLPVPRLARNEDLDTEGDSEVSDEDEIRWRERQTLRQSP